MYTFLICIIFMIIIISIAPTITIYNIAIINVFAVLFVFLLIFATLIQKLLEKKRKGFLKSVMHICPECQEKFSNFLTRRKKIATKANGTIKFTTEIQLTLLLANIVMIFCCAFNTPEEIQALFSSASVISDVAIDILSIIIFKLCFITEIIFLVINIFLYILFGYEKVDTIICVCNNCGTVIEIDSDIKISKEIGV